MLPAGTPAARREILRDRDQRQPRFELFPKSGHRNNDGDRRQTFTRAPTPGSGDVQIVGVVGDVRFANPRNPSPYAIYIPVLQHEYGGQWGDVLVRSAAGRVAEVDVRQAVDSLGREHVAMYRTLEQVTDRTILQERVTAMIAGSLECSHWRCARSASTA